MRFAFALLMLTVAGCGSTRLGLGGGCTSDSNCEGGLSCLATADSTVQPDGGCASTAGSITFCSKVCTTDSDCASLEQGSFQAKCLGCPGSQICAQVSGSPGST